MKQSRSSNLFSILSSASTISRNLGARHWRRRSWGCSRRIEWWRRARVTRNDNSNSWHSTCDPCICYRLPCNWRKPRCEKAVFSRHPTSDHVLKIIVEFILLQNLKLNICSNFFKFLHKIKYLFICSDGLGWSSQNFRGTKIILTNFLIDRDEFVWFVIWNIENN